MATTLDALVHAALSEREPELRELIRQVVDRDLDRLIREVVEQELELRRNGAGAELPVAPPEEGATPGPPREERPPLGMKACLRCRESKPVESFPRDHRARDGRRNVCTSCRSRRRAERKAAAADTEEPHPVRGRTTTSGRLRSAAEQEQREQTRELLAKLRSNGTTTELIGGREFRVIRVPSFEDDRRGEDRVPIVPRRRRSIALA
jgi:hypothetical protein